MRDYDIRATLKREFMSLYANEPNTLIIDELGLCKGTVRVDIAVVNGTLNGYEIKSERDTLERLPYQQEIYSRTFDTVTIVTNACHMDKIMTLIPEWWGVIKVVENGDKVYLERIRKAILNSNVDAFSLAQLLWRDEVLAILRERGLVNGLLNKPRQILWQKAADNLPIEELRRTVRDQLRSRENWRSL